MQAEHFEETWSAWKGKPVNLDRIDTDMIRTGWPAPTIYREHEVIHVMCNWLDAALAEIARLKEQNEV